MSVLAHAVLPLPRGKFPRYELLNEVQRGSTDGIIGVSAALDKVRSLVSAASRVSIPVLVTGETGSGKELVAEAIHKTGLRNSRPFVAVNCAAVPETLAETLFFGHVRGAYTDAINERHGFFEQAQDGTLFLDEIGDLPPTLQPKLLRAVETGLITRVGASKTTPIDVRLVAATNLDLDNAVKKGKFREDLYYRLNTFRIHLLPLRERTEDIPVLAETFLMRFNSDNGTGIFALPKVLDRLAALILRGNARELKNIVFNAATMALAESVPISEEILNQALMNLRVLVDEVASGVYAGRTRTSVPMKTLNIESLTKLATIKALRSTDGNMRDAAEILGVSVKTLYNYRKTLHEAGIDDEMIMDSDLDLEGHPFIIGRG